MPRYCIVFTAYQSLPYSDELYAYEVPIYADNKRYPPTPKIFITYSQAVQEIESLFVKQPRIVNILYAQQLTTKLHWWYQKRDKRNRIIKQPRRKIRKSF